MTSLKYWNSGVESNGAAFILSPSGYGVVFRVLGASEEEALSSVLGKFASQFLVGDAASNDLFHDASESFRVSKVPSVISKRLLVDVAKQVERFHALI